MSDQERRVMMDTIAGAVLGVMGAAFNQSPLGNLVSNVIAAVGVNALSAWPLKQQAFWSRDTALSTLTIAATGGITHMVTDALIHRHRDVKPHITFAPDCGCKAKGWVDRAGAKNSAIGPQL